jgi:hypothetical protein
MEHDHAGELAAGRERAELPGRELVNTHEVRFR